MVDKLRFLVFRRISGCHQHNFFPAIPYEDIVLQKPAWLQTTIFPIKLLIGLAIQPTTKMPSKMEGSLPGNSKCSHKTSATVVLIFNKRMTPIAFAGGW